MSWGAIAHTTRLLHPYHTTFFVVRNPERKARVSREVLCPHTKRHEEPPAYFWPHHEAGHQGLFPPKRGPRANRGSQHEGLQDPRFNTPYSTYYHSYVPPSTNFVLVGCKH